jgi:hypothetical protein
MREHNPFGGAVAAEFICDNDPRFASCSAKEFSKEALRRDPVAFWLNEDVDHGPVLIDSTPKIMLGAVDLQETSSRCHFDPRFPLFLRRSSSA